MRGRGSARGLGSLLARRPGSRMGADEEPPCSARAHAAEPVLGPGLGPARGGARRRLRVARGCGRVRRSPSAAGSGWATSTVTEPTRSPGHLEGSVDARVQPASGPVVRVRSLRRPSARFGLEEASVASGGPLRIIRLVQQRPGISIKQIGDELGIDPTGLYRPSASCSSRAPSPNRPRGGPLRAIYGDQALLYDLLAARATYGIWQLCSPPTRARPAAPTSSKFGRSSSNSAPEQELRHQHRIAVHYRRARPPLLGFRPPDRELAGLFLLVLAR
jgi:hypothetical protein